MNRGMFAPRRCSTQIPTSTPPAMPPQTPRPPRQIANGPHQASGTSFQLVARKYSRPPIRPAGEAPNPPPPGGAPPPPRVSPPPGGATTAPRTAQTEQKAEGGGERRPEGEGVSA